MNFIDDVNAIRAVDRRIIDSSNNVFARGIHSSTTGCIKFYHIGMRTLSHTLTLLTRTIRYAVRCGIAQKRLCKQACHGGFSRSTRPGKQVRMAYTSPRKSVYQRRLYNALPYNVAKNLRAIFRIKRLRHNYPPNDT